MLTKLGEAIEISKIEETNSCIPAVDSEILNNFKKFATNLKLIAPKAEDFLYFSGVMMHAAEAAAINDDGTPKLTASGEPVKVGWEINGDSWRWTTNDPRIKPVKNSNGDAFPENELIKAHKKWIGKPLCIDHKSNSVDHVRGFIVDTHYDRNLKRVVALCALDKKNYPDLARKVYTGYSNSLSMGTAVGKAVCFDCGRVARSEADFCDHMRSKTCYCEINTELNPIELSIVVNGADPKAHIKHVIAAANTLNNYVQSKEQELNKIAATFSASFAINSGENEDQKNASFNLTSPNLESFKEDIAGAIKKLEEISKSIESGKEFTESSKDTAYNQSSGTIAMDETISQSTDFGLAPPHARFADNDIKELKVTIASIETKLSHIKQSLTELTTKEEKMSGSNINKQGYFQGAGNENEPSPGQPKYPKDPKNEDLRLDGDKHMLADDTGPVDGMHPGPDSVNMSELERKKMLARATAEERAIRRTAIVNMAKQALEQKKQAYFQGGGGVNEPTPGKPKYPVDQLNADMREDGDKQMVGQKPFPGVGAINGLHPSPDSADPSDEKKRKEMLQRASLRARFIKAANHDGTQNLGNSAWQVFQGDKLILTASVNELSGNRAGVLYDSIATKEFGSKLIEKIKVQGADKIRALIKNAQTPAPEAAPPAPEAAPPAPEATPTAEPAPAENVIPEDTGKSGDPKETALELAEKVRDLSSDLVEAVRALVGEKAEMGEESPAPAEMGATASEFGTSTLNTLRKELNGALTQAMKEAVAELNDHQQELDMIVGLYDRGNVNDSNKDLVGSIVEDALTEAKASVVDGFKLMSAFVKYARGTKAIVKRAEIEAELQALASEGEVMDVVDVDTDATADVADLINETDTDLAEVETMLSDDTNDVETDLAESDADLEQMLADIGDTDDNDAVISGNVKPEELSKLTPGTEIDKAKVATVEGRAELRAKLAAEALKTSPHLHEAHPKGSFTTQLDVKPSDDLAAVEDLEDEHSAMMDVATAPPKVRKEAEAIHKLISEGKLNPADLDALIAEGLDKDAVAYYKKYYNQVEGGSEFASELVKEHVKAQLEEQLNQYRVKLARAYELTYDMINRGLCHNDRNAISTQVDEIMKFNDESFESLKRVVAKHTPILNKTAGHIPQVGLIDSGEGTANDGTLVDQLSAALSKTTKKLF